MIDEHKKAVFFQMVATADLNLSGNCPLAEDEAIVWAGKRIEELQRDKLRLDWLADRDNHHGNVSLPKECVFKHIDSMRFAIDAAMEHYRQS